MINKIKSPQELLSILNDYRAKGLKIVFTNGCFDLIHIGHIRYLTECKKAGDILIVGLNTDKSVKLNKGDLRPVVPYDERAEILANLEIVDFVVPFEEKTPLNLIKLLKPDFLIKGGDYSVDTIVGSEDVEANGGSVYTIPLIEGKSSRNIIKTILDKFSS